MQRRQLSVRLMTSLVAICVVFLLIGGAADAEAPPQPGVEYVVRPGDTLWSIAGSIAHPGDDVRDAISLIKEMSGITSSDLHPGQILLLPGS